MKTSIFLTAILCLLLSSRAFSQYDEQFYGPSREWTPIQRIAFEEVWLPAGQDTLNAVFFKPAAAPLATVFFFHGGGGNISTFVDYVRPLVAAGFQVFTIDFRGFGRSTGKPTHLNIAADGQMALDYLLRRPDVQNQRVILYGASMGTPVAAKLARDNTKKIAALVMDGTISSFTDIAAASVPAEQQAMVRQYVTSPYSPVQDVKLLPDIPKLFIASPQDSVVPFSQTEAVFDAAPDPKELLPFEGNHLELMQIHPEKIIGQIMLLLNK